MIFKRYIGNFDNCKSEKETIFAKFEAAEKEILSQKKPGVVCADFIEFMKKGLN